VNNASRPHFDAIMRDPSTIPANLWIAAGVYEDLPPDLQEMVDHALAASVAAIDDHRAESLTPGTHAYRQRIWRINRQRRRERAR
jgi:hypothetical protein